MQAFVLFSLAVAALSLGVSLQLESSPFDQESKLVVAHFIVGNTYPYTVDDWTQDIALASSKGIDAFALNVGRDPWQPQRVQDAFTAASNLATNGTSFKLFLTFDMTSLPCSVANDADVLRKYITDYASHPNQLVLENNPLISTFSGENCRFGTSSLQDGWMTAVKTALPPIHFIPSFFLDPSTFASLPVMDGAMNWNGAWPPGNSPITYDSDLDYINNLGGRSYMATVSPWFFTHYGPDSYNKNFIYRGDDWLLSQRWEILINNRDSSAVVQIISWNDYGESHYVGPIEGAQPNSQAWTNGYDHQAWLDLIQYYIAAYKSGTYPDIMRDKIFLWARLYPANANAPDPVPRPTNWQLTMDTLWSVVFLSQPAQVNLTCGTSNQVVTLPAGVSKLSLPLVAPCSVNAMILRSGEATVDLTPPGLNFSVDPPSYNFNAFVAMSS